VVEEDALVVVAGQPGQLGEDLGGGHGRVSEKVARSTGACQFDGEPGA
jgi:hypothetical protein